MKLEAYDDHWILDAKIDSTSTIEFYGRPCEFVIPDSYSHFRLVIRKDSLIPDRLSYLRGYPRQKIEVTCDNLVANPFPVDSSFVEAQMNNVGKT